MKKFNAKKVIVSIAVSVLFIGGTVVAANEFLRWQGEQEAAQISQNLDTLDDMLTEKESKINKLDSLVTTLLEKFDLLEENADKTLEEKIDSIEESAALNKTNSDYLLTFLYKLETSLFSEIKTGDVSSRINAIKTAVTDELAEKERLIGEVSRLEGELTTSQDVKANLQTQLNDAEVDVQMLETKSTTIINNHGVDIENAPVVKDSDELPVTVTEPLD